MSILSIYLFCAQNKNISTQLLVNETFFEAFASVSVSLKWTVALKMDGRKRVC